MVSRRGTIPGLAVAGALLVCPPYAHASTTVYEYHIEHPRYGDIGTYSNTVKEIGDDTEIDSELHVAVRLLGVVMYREDATRVERWKAGRFVAFAGVTVTNGKRIELKGEARGEEFVIASQDGTITAPARVHPSNPWAPSVLNTDLMMSTKTGRIDQVQVSGGGVEGVTFDGKNWRLHRYEISGSKRQFVWLDERGTAIAFRTEQDGTPIDFILTRPPQTEAASR